MDGQNFENEQNVTENNYYQDNTDVTPVAPVVEAAPANKADALAIVGLIAGILSIVICCSTYYALIPGIIGIVCSILSKKQNGKTGVATAGLICSIVGSVLAIIWTIVCLVIGAAGLAMLESSGVDMSSFY